LAIRGGISHGLAIFVLGKGLESDVESFIIKELSLSGGVHLCYKRVK
jgi:hypothetical protein